MYRQNRHKLYAEPDEIGGPLGMTSLTPVVRFDSSMAMAVRMAVEHPGRGRVKSPQTLAVYRREANFSRVQLVGIWMGHEQEA